MRWAASGGQGSDIILNLRALQQRPINQALDAKRKVGEVTDQRLWSPCCVTVFLQSRSGHFRIGLEKRKTHPKGEGEATAGCGGTAADSIQWHGHGIITWEKAREGERAREL